MRYVSYLQSHGTEWVDTLLRANQNTRVEAVVTATEAQSSGAVIGAEQVYQDRMFAIDTYGCFYGTGVYRWSSLGANAEHKVEANGNRFYLDDSLVYTAPAETFTTPVTLTVFGFNVAANGGVTQLIKAKIPYIKIWQDGTNLSRDYKAALDDNGVPCFRDELTGQYHYNAGSGAFGYGSILVPRTPPGFETADVTRNAISLRWNAVIDAVGYKLYRDNVLIQTLGGTEFTDSGLAADTQYSYSVASYNESGEGSRSTIAARTLGNTAPTEPLVTTGQSNRGLLLKFSSAGAESFSVYSNEELLYSGSNTEYLDENVRAFQAYTYRVIASNEYGDSSPTMFSTSFIPPDPLPWLITDRTEEDVIAASTAVLNEDLKGSYNASDLNRVGSAILYVASSLIGFVTEIREYAEDSGVSYSDLFVIDFDVHSLSAITAKTNWTRKDVPHYSDSMNLFNALNTIADQVDTGVEIPESLDVLDYEGANNMEKLLLYAYGAAAEILEDRKAVVDLAVNTEIYCGEVCSSEGF